MTTTTQTRKHINKQAYNSKKHKSNKKKEKEKTNKQISNNNNNNNNNNNKNNINNNKLKLKKKIIQLLTVAPELVTLDSSLTHVLQASNTQPYHS